MQLCTIKHALTSHEYELHMLHKVDVLLMNTKHKELFFNKVPET